MAPTDHATDLGSLLEDQDPVVAPGCFSALEAMLAERAGHEAVYMSGAATNVGQYGQFDGLLGMAEMAENAGRLAGATALPVIADADTGYGGVHNVRRTVRAYAEAGVAALQLEDQRWPKRCGHAAGKEIVPRADARARIQAAVDARDAADRDILVIARTDAFGAANGDWDEHVARGRLFADLGADLLMPEMPDPSREHAVRYAEAIHETHPDATLLWNYSSNFAWHDVDDPLTFAELGELGYGVIIVSLFGMHAAVASLWEYLDALAEEGAPAQWRLEEALDGHEAFGAAEEILFDLGDFAAYRAMEERYLEDARARYAASAGHAGE